MTTVTPIHSPTKSHELFERAKRIIPGGVNSPVRACQAVGGEPIVIQRADGSHVYDLDGNGYIDYVGSFGPLILGHSHPRVLAAIETALRHGTTFGALCKSEVDLAELIAGAMPSIEMIRMVNSGTEACMSAVRLARAFTKRQIIIKFDGCYHGHYDSFLVKSGSGLATLGISSSLGVPDDFTKFTLSLPFNDIKKVEEAFEKHKDQIACIITEPIIGNAGVILPEDNFLEKLRELCTANGALLIFDEVMTGFRVAFGGAQALYKIKPDLTCLGKIIGGGLPVGAYGGRRDIMEMVAPSGEVYQAGTLSGNPLAMAAGLAQLKGLQSFNYNILQETTEKLAKDLEAIAEKSSLDLQVAHTTGMISIFFNKNKVNNFADAQASDTDAFGRLWRTLMHEGIYWPPSQFEAAFISTVHTREDISDTLAVFKKALTKS